MVQIIKKKKQLLPIVGTGDPIAAVVEERLRALTPLLKSPFDNPIEK